MVSTSGHKKETKGNNNDNDTKKGAPNFLASRQTGRDRQPGSQLGRKTGRPNAAKPETRDVQIMQKYAAVAGYTST